MSAQKQAAKTRIRLIKKRNQKIRERFVELYETQGVRIDWVVEQLCDEFFLSEETIIRITRAA